MKCIKIPPEFQSVFEQIISSVLFILANLYN